MHDGSWVDLPQGGRALRPDRSRHAPTTTSASSRRKARSLTGLLYISPDSQDMAEQNELVPEPLTTLPYEQLCPGSAELEKLQARFR